MLFVISERLKHDSLKEKGKWRMLDEVKYAPAR